MLNIDKMKLKKLINLYENIPGVSKKLSLKMALKTISNEELKSDLVKIVDIANQLEYCGKCGIIKETNIACDNCALPSELLLVFQNQLDIISIEDKTTITGTKFIMGFDNKKQFTNFEEIKTMTSKLIEFVKKENFSEILFMLSPSIETEIIIKVITEELVMNKIEVIFTKISTGVPFGGSVEYSDEITLRKAMEKREQIK